MSSPFGVVVLEEEAITDALYGSSVFSIGGPMENQIVGLRTRWFRKTDSVR